MADDQTPSPAPDLTSLTPDMINQLYARLQQGLPNIQPDRTPVDTSGFWGGLRHGVSLLGEFAGSPGPETLKALSPAEREQAGLQALSRFGTGLMGASHYVPGQTFGSNLAQGFQAAEHGYDTTTRQAMGMLAARQGYAVEQQRDQLARIKEAIPLLTLKQKMDAIKALPPTLSGVTPGTSITTGGSIGMPSEYLPFYQEASARTGIPVEVLIAQGKQESGFNPNAANGGIHQILDSTARKPGFGMAGVDPATLKDPRANINFGADYLAARAKAAGADFSTPEGTAKALAAYNGGGDKDYASKVMALIPGARGALAPPPSVAPSAALPGQAPPPPTGGSALPPPEAPLVPEAGTAQVAGRGAPTSGIIPPSPPGSPAAVADIMAGMVGAGANPNTLAVGPVPPGMPTGTAAAGPAAPAPAPDSYEAYQLQHPITPSPEHQRLFNPGPDPDQLKAIQERRRNAEQIYQQARSVDLDPGAAAKARAVYDKAIADEATLRENARKLGTETQAKYYAEQDKQRFEAWTAERNDARAQAKDAAAQAAAIRLKEVEGDQARQSTAAGAVVDRNKKALEGLDADSAAAAKQLPQLDAFRILSDNVPDGSSDTLRKLANVSIGGTPLITHMAQLGLADPTKVGAIQQLQGAISGITAELRSGMSMGPLSDRDLDFISSLGPRLYEDQATRSAVVSYLKQARQVRMRFNAEISKEMTRPGMDFATASEKVVQDFETKHPIVPRMTQDIADHWADQSDYWKQERVKWARDNNVKQHTLVRQPNGSLRLVE